MTVKYGILKGQCDDSSTVFYIHCEERVNNIIDMEKM